MFNLWNPTVTAEGCELDVTRAEFFSLHEGSPELVRAFLDAWGITGEITDWKIERIRTSYFSDYLEDEDWRDRWQWAWILKVRGRFVPPDDTGVYETLKFVHELDSGDDEKSGPERCRALIIAGARDPRDVIDAVAIPKVMAAAEAHGFARGRIEIGVRQVVPGEKRGTEESDRTFEEGARAWLASIGRSGDVLAGVSAKRDRARNPLYQVRMLLADADFPADEPALSALCAHLKDQGFFVHRHALEFDALTPRG
ncbi:MAG TPA: hypothetical protein VKQ32_04765 [Polyangia bacterium]|nr:hypothetical protein [Polyangia bacterium]